MALIPASLTNLQRTGVTYKSIRETSPLTEIHLAWRGSDEMPTLRVFVDLALLAARARRTPAGSRSTT